MAQTFIFSNTVSKQRPLCPINQDNLSLWLSKEDTENNYVKNVKYSFACTRIMHITLYKSILCPRCHFARKYLLEITADDPEIEVKEVDIMTAPRQSWNAGIRLIPALRINDHILSAMFMSKTTIADFIASHKH